MTRRPLLFDSPLLATGPDPLINPSLLFLFQPRRSKLPLSSLLSKTRTRLPCLLGTDCAALGFRITTYTLPILLGLPTPGLCLSFQSPFTFSLTLSKLRCYSSLHSKHRWCTRAYPANLEPLPLDGRYPNKQKKPLVKMIPDKECSGKIHDDFRLQHYVVCCAHYTPRPTRSSVNLNLERLSNSSL